MAPENETIHEETTHLLDDIICHRILPRLPCKLLSRCKVISKGYNALIAPNTCFANFQFINPSPASTGFVYINDGKLSFLADQDNVGVPDPSLEFMVKSLKDVKLLASANGLLLFYLLGGVDSLCICNPATMEKTVLPKEEPEDNIRKAMGLVFNPFASPKKYVVVDPLFKFSSAGNEYSFNVFSSQTGKWTCSREKVFMPGLRCPPTRPVCALGLVYWSCIDYLLWFDPDKDRTGTIQLPNCIGLGNMREVEVYKDELNYMCITFEGEIEVWRLIGGTKWNRLYELSTNTLIHENSPNLCFGLPISEAETRCILGNYVVPLAFDGRNIYLAVNMKAWRLEKDWLVSIKNIDFGEDVLSFMDPTDEDGSLFYDTEIDANDDFETSLEKELLCCDMVTGKLVNTGKSVVQTNRNFRIFYYHNSMAAVPPISK
ncbi:F-box protein [Rhynchospora pubera]|uniref:F-box protein n=1 Tax=Rhynchospora pubera TaxID=906938 RepID=A0AAV8GPL9_9POAL|nr:F-box protein [Rhynchospora pubera]